MECFIPLMEKFNNIYGHYPKYPVADAGYGSYMSTSYVSYTKPIFEVIKIPKILEKSSFFACVESKCVI